MTPPWRAASPELNRNSRTGPNLRAFSHPDISNAPQGRRRADFVSTSLPTPDSVPFIRGYDSSTDANVRLALMAKPVTPVAVMMVVTIILMQTSTPALQRDFENAVFQAVGSRSGAGLRGRASAVHVRARDALFGIGRSSCTWTTYLIEARTDSWLVPSNYPTTKGGAPARGNATAPLITTRRSELRAGLCSV